MASTASPRNMAQCGNATRKCAPKLTATNAHHRTYIIAEIGIVASENGAWRGQSIIVAAASLTGENALKRGERQRQIGASIHVMLERNREGGASAAVSAPNNLTISAICPARRREYMALSK